MSVRPETEDFISFLNDLVSLDQAFVSRLVNTHVPCSKAIADHESVQAFRDGDIWRAGFLGVINGFLGVVDGGPRSGWGPISAVIDHTGKVERFAKTETLIPDLEGI